MDGFPLDQDQAISFTRLIGTPDTVIYLNVSAELMKDRLKKRGNFDDNEASIDKRINTFCCSNEYVCYQFQVALVVEGVLNVS